MWLSARAQLFVASRRFRAEEAAGLRVWQVKGFKRYLIFYQPTADGIEVVRVLHWAAQSGVPETYTFRPPSTKQGRPWLNLWMQLARNLTLTHRRPSDRPDIPYLDDRRLKGYSRTATLS